MRKMCIVLALALLLSVSSSAAWAQEDAWVEVIRIDGASVVVLDPETMMLREVDSLSLGTAGETTPGLALPKALTEIGERAFEAIAAEKVEVSENVETIGPYAFANCMNLREITIPDSVQHIDDTAFVGCADVRVYGNPDTEAARIAALYSFELVSAADAEPEAPAEALSAKLIPTAPVLPAVPLR